MAKLARQRGTGEIEVACGRCGRACQGADPARDDARPFKRATQGLCTECVVAAFFKDDDPNRGIGFALPHDFDPEGFRLPHIQAQFRRVLDVGHSELSFDDINWDVVISNWALPLPLPRGKR